MFSCGLCREEWCVQSSLCPKCDVIYKLGKIYGWDTIYNIIEKCLVIPQDNQNSKLISTVNIIGNTDEKDEEDEEDTRY